MLKTTLEKTLVNLQLARFKTVKINIIIEVNSEAYRF